MPRKTANRPAALVMAACLMIGAAPLQAEDGWPLHAALGAYMTLNGTDLAQTMTCIGAQRCREANRFMGLVANQPATFGAVKIGLTSAAVYGILRIHTDHPRLAWVLAGIGIAAEAAATAHNAKLVR